MSKSFSNKVIEFENGLVVGSNGAVRAPSTYKVNTGDLDLESKRSTSGYLNRNRVRGGKNTAYTLEVSWNKLTWSELVSLIEAGNNAKFTLTFLDPASKNGYVIKTMMRDANMSYEMISIDDEEAYWTTSMAFVEY